MRKELIPTRREWLLLSLSQRKGEDIFWEGYILF